MRRFYPKPASYKVDYLIKSDFKFNTETFLILIRNLIKVFFILKQFKDRMRQIFLGSILYRFRYIYDVCFRFEQNYSPFIAIFY